MQWLLAALGVVGGAVTHLVWDAFTHEGARGIRMVPALGDPVVDIAGHRLIGAGLLQDASSLIGLAVVLAIVAYGLRPGQAQDAAPTRVLKGGERHAWMLGYAATALLLSVLFALRRRPFDTAAHSLTLLVGNLAIAVLRGLAAALVLVSLGLMIRLRAFR